eukprot:ctg_408.g292
MLKNSADELWLGVKCQSNPELAGSPRNALTAQQLMLQSR